MTIRLKVNKKLERFATVHKPLKIIIGGRGSGKSIGVADIMTGLKMNVEGANMMGIREFQQSIQDSVHNVMGESIQKRMCLEGWEVQEKRIISPEGAKTLYIGAARNPTSLQSVHGYRYSWFEEAQTASERSLDTLIPTILRTEGAECWFTANPQASGDPFSQRFIVPFLKDLTEHGYYEDDMHMILVLNWRDNPWWNDAQEALRKLDYANMTRAKYNWIWEGDFNDSVEDSIIMPEWFDACVDVHKDPKFAAAMVPHGAKVVSYDPFDDGGDAGGLAIRHGSVIQQVRSKQTGEIDECTDWATGIAYQERGDFFVWDGDGMGTGLKRQVSTAFEGTATKYHMFKGSLSGKGQDNANRTYLSSHGDGESKNKNQKYKDAFKNNRAQYYGELARRMHNTYLAVTKELYMDPDDMISLNTSGIDDIIGLRSQICRIPSRPNANGMLQIMNKQEMKKLGIMSPNESDAIMMSLYQPAVTVDDIEIEFDNWN